MGANPNDDAEGPKTSKRSFLKLVGSSALALGSVAGAGVGAAQESDTPNYSSVMFKEVNPEEEYFVLLNASSGDIYLSGAVAAMGYEGSEEQRRAFPDEPKREYAPDGPVAYVYNPLKVATGAKDVPDADVTLGFDEPVMSDDQSDVYTVLDSDGDVMARSDAAETGYDHELEILGTGDDPAHYRFFATSLAPDPYTNEKWDDMNSGVWEGWVPGNGEGIDRYYFNDRISEFEITEGEAVVEVDGERVDPEALNAGYRHSIRIQGTGDPANYWFWTSSDIEPAPGTLEKWDEVVEHEPVPSQAAKGWVTSEENVDKFYFDGYLDQFAFLEGDADVTLDTKPLHTVEITGRGEPTNYRFDVDGDLYWKDGMKERWDEVSDEGSVDGWVTDTDDVDQYSFTGEITEFAFEQGSATVVLDGEDVSGSIAD